MGDSRAVDNGICTDPCGVGTAVYRFHAGCQLSLCGIGERKPYLIPRHGPAEGRFFDRDGKTDGGVRLNRAARFILPQAAAEQTAACLLDLYDRPLWPPFIIGPEPDEDTVTRQGIPQVPSSDEAVLPFVQAGKAKAA